MREPAREPANRASGVYAARWPGTGRCTRLGALEAREHKMVIRLRYKQLGGHVHCRLFTAREVRQTFAKCGDLVFDELEWPVVKARFESIGEVLEDHYSEEMLDQRIRGELLP